MSIMGILKSMVNPMSLMQLAMGPAGWASLAMKTIGSQIAMQLIQTLGQKIGLPQSMIDLAQAAFANASGQPGLMRENIGQAVGNLVNDLNLRPSEAGQMQRALMGASDKSFSNLQDIVNSFAKKFSEDGNSDSDGNVKGKGSKAGGSWLVAFAKAMGTALDAKAAQIKEKSDSIATMADSNVDRKSQDGSKHNEKLASETQLLQAFAQEMSLISNAATNALKSVGEALTTTARK